MLAVGIVIAHPDCCGKLRRIADKPDVAVGAHAAVSALGRASLARNRTVDLGLLARTALHDLLHHFGHLVSGTLLHDPLGGRVGFVGRFTRAVRNRLDRISLPLLTACCKGRIGLSHL
ncbi:hypothetical protein D3C71_1636680 [compost metagenome]